MIRPIVIKEALQMEVTNACSSRCSNCTRLVGHHKKPYFMDLEYFKEVIDSFKKYDCQKMIGFIGGEPLMHPEFEELCVYVNERFPKAQLGLWSSLPIQYKHYADIISKTFGALLPNDHSGGGIYHSPVMVSSKEIIGEGFKQAVKECWLQKSWSASVNPKGAYFCEVAAAMDLLLDTGTAFDIHDPWWLKHPVEYWDQIEALCSHCSVPLSLTPRLDTDGIDDMDPFWYEKVKETSPKVKAGKYKIYNGPIKDTSKNYQINSFRKDMEYLRGIGLKFGLDLVLKKNGYLRPYKAA